MVAVLAGKYTFMEWIVASIHRIKGTVTSEEVFCNAMSGVWAQLI